MAYLHFLAPAAVGFLDEPFLDFGVAHIWSREFVAKGCQLVTECRSGVDAGMLGIGDFEFIVHEHTQILVQRLWLHLLGVILIVEIFELAQRYVMTVDGEKHGVVTGSGSGCHKPHTRNGDC